MSTLTSVILDDVRERLNEESALEWTDATLIRYIDQAHKWLAGWLGKLKRSGYFEYQEEITLSADTTLFALSGFTKSFKAMKFLEYVSTAGTYLPCGVIQEGDEYAYRGTGLAQVTGQVAPDYLIRRPNLVCMPQSSQARTLRATYRYKPDTLDEGSDALETPEEFDDIIVARVCFYALADEGESNSSFEDIYSARLAEIEEDVVSTVAEGGSITTKSVDFSDQFGGL